MRGGVVKASGRGRIDLGDRLGHQNVRLSPAVGVGDEADNLKATPAIEFQWVPIADCNRFGLFEDSGKQVGAEQAGSPKIIVGAKVDGQEAQRPRPFLQGGDQRGSDALSLPATASGCNSRLWE
jgi:hypothetical protein